MKILILNFVLFFLIHYSTPILAHNSSLPEPVPMNLPEISGKHLGNMSAPVGNQVVQTMIFSGNSYLGKEVTISFPEVPTLTTSQATLCSNDVALITEIKLWMPDHGHGSAPIESSEMENQSECIIISNLIFLMPGHWDINISFLDGDKIAIALMIPADTKTFKAKTKMGMRMQLVFSDTPSKNVHQAKLCTDQVAELIDAQLWMPAHGHGSVPTTLSPIDSYCTAIDDIEFIMGGSWEIRVTFTSGDSGVFNVEI